MKNSKIWNKYHKDQVTIDHFEIVEKLGEGKFGNVFLAVEKATRLMVALKMVEKKRVLDDNFLTQFIR